MKYFIKFVFVIILCFVINILEEHSASANISGEQFILDLDTEVYDTAEDAIRTHNAKLIYPAGEYYIHRESEGMLNISKSKFKYGAWINPNILNIDNSIEIKVEAPEIYTLKENTDVYPTSTDAKKRIVSNQQYNRGEYYIYKIENGMLNITAEQNKEGLWINPSADNIFTGYENKRYYVENTLANGWYNDGSGEYFFYLGEKYTGYAKDSTGMKYFNKGRYSSKKSSKKNISRTKDKNLAINSFQYLNLKSKTKYTSEELNRAIERFGGIDSKLYGKGYLFKEAEEKYKINALYLLSHAAIESSWGHSQIAYDKNNFFGISAFDEDAYKSATSFENVDEGILKGAEWISSKYLHSNEYPANGAFLGNKTEGMNRNYATDVRWGRNIARVMKEINNYLGNKEK